MAHPFTIRPLLREDRAQWKVLWDGYNGFYGRSGSTALPESITEATWERFFDPAEPVHALVAADGARVVGLAHYVLHRSTTRLNDVCYLQDLFTAEDQRGRGVARALIAAVADWARTRGCARVYWHTQASNSTARYLYDQVAENHGFIQYRMDLLH